MGQIRFVARNHDRLADDVLNRAYLAGMEGIPWQSSSRVDQGQIVIERTVAESGNLYIPWHVAGHGELTMSTASLMERAGPYELTLELARGTLNRLRNQIADLELAGLRISDDVKSKSAQSLVHMKQAVTAAGGEDAAARSIAASLDAIRQLGHEQAELLLELRHRTDARLPTVFAGPLTTASMSPPNQDVFAATFNSAMIEMNWRAIQPDESSCDWSAVDARLAWCEDRGLRVCGGPLVRLVKSSIPDWVRAHAGDFPSIEASVVKFVTAACSHLKGRVLLWVAAAALNIGGELSLSEEERLRLAVSTIEAVRRVDTTAPVVISFDQPWAEYMVAQTIDLSPLHFADALIRADLGLAGVGLEINLGYWPGGTQPRDSLEISRQVDRWSLLGLPLLVGVGIPSGIAHDPQASFSGRVLPDCGDMIPSPEQQSGQAQLLFPLLLAKSSVHGLYWTQQSDAERHAFPHAGLFDHHWRPKPVLATLEAIRLQHLS